MLVSVHDGRAGGDEPAEVRERGLHRILPSVGRDEGDNDGAETETDQHGKPTGHRPHGLAWLAIAGSNVVMLRGLEHVLSGAPSKPSARFVNCKFPVRSLGSHGFLSDVHANLQFANRIALGRSDDGLRARS